MAAKHWSPLQVPNEDPNYIEEGRKRWKKTRDITLWSVWGRGVASKLTPQHFTPSGWPQTGTPALRTLAGKSMAALKALEELGEVTAVEVLRKGERGGTARIAHHFRSTPPSHGATAT